MFFARESKNLCHPGIFRAVKISGIQNQPYLLDPGSRLLLPGVEALGFLDFRGY
jgi:hypothetical protein